MIGAMFAVYINKRASEKGLPTHRPVFAGIACVAAAYVVMFAVFLLVEPHFKHWYSILRGLGVIAWFFVWAAPASRSMKTWRRIQTAVDEASLIEVGEVPKETNQ